MILSTIVDWQVWMRLLSLEFPKWLPLQWKWQKYDFFLNALNVQKISKKMYSHAYMCIHC